MYKIYCCCTCNNVIHGLESSDLLLTLMNAFSIFISNRDVMYLLDIKSYIHPGAECNCPVAIYTHLVAMTTLYRWNSYVFRTVCI